MRIYTAIYITFLNVKIIPVFFHRWARNSAKKPKSRWLKWDFSEIRHCLSIESILGPVTNSAWLSRIDSICTWNLFPKVRTKKFARNSLGSSWHGSFTSLKGWGANVTCYFQMWWCGRPISIFERKKRHHGLYRERAQFNVQERVIRPYVVPPLSVYTILTYKPGLYRIILVYHHSVVDHTYAR